MPDGSRMPAQAGATELQQPTPRGRYEQIMPAGVNKDMIRAGLQVLDWWESDACVDHSRLVLVAKIYAAMQDAATAEAKPEA